MKKAPGNLPRGFVYILIVLCFQWNTLCHLGTLHL